MKDLSQIKEIVESVFDVPDISIKSRLGNIITARQVYFLLARKYSGKTIQKIANKINAHHAMTVYHSVRALELIELEKEFREKFNECEVKLLTETPIFYHKKAIEMIEYWTSEKEKIEKECPELFGKIEENN